MQAVPVAWGLRAPLKDIMEATESVKFVEGIKGSSRAHARVLADGLIRDKEWGGADLWKTVEVTWTVTHDGVTHVIPFSLLVKGSHERLTQLEGAGRVFFRCEQAPKAEGKKGAKEAGSGARW